MASDLTLRRLAPGELAAFQDALDLGFHEPAAPAEAREHWARLLELDRTAVVFDGETLVGTSGAFSFRLSIPGGELPCAGVTVVTVRPTHRRRGLLTRMLARLHDDARERGEPIAALTASEGGIYGRFGYGVATWAGSYRIDGDARPRDLDAAGTAPASPIELRDPAGATELLAPVWERMRTVRPGLPSRTATWWDQVLDDHPDLRDGALPTRLALARDTAGNVTGYALYRARPARDADAGATLEVVELVAPDPAAEARLWAYLCSIDLVDHIDAPSRPVDDPLPLRFSDLRSVRAKAQEDVLWLRVLDVPAALSARRWAHAVDLVLAVEDALMPANARAWRLEVGADGAGRCTETDRAPDLLLDVRTLGAVYLGGTSLLRLADAGEVVERTPGAVLALDAALHVPRAPWTPEEF
jgi:predicted acetyltransferase